MAKKKKITVRQKAFLEIFSNSLANISIACKKTGISRQTYYNWRKDNSAFDELAWEVEEGELDFSETMLKRNIREGKEVSIIFHLKTKGKDRGYVERQEQQLVGIDVVGVLEELEKLRSGKSTDTDSE